MRHEMDTRMFSDVKGAVIGRAQRSGRHCMDEIWYSSPGVCFVSAVKRQGG